MLRIIEFGLLAVSLLVVIGLIISGSRNRAGTTPSAGLDDDGDAREQSKNP